MHKPESVPENNTNGPPNPTRRPDLVLTSRQELTN